jgi:hypothetical protein
MGVSAKIDSVRQNIVPIVSDWFGPKCPLP